MTSEVRTFSLFGGPLHGSIVAVAADDVQGYEYRVARAEPLDRLAPPWAPIRMRVGRYVVRDAFHVSPFRYEHEYLTWEGYEEDFESLAVTRNE